MTALFELCGALPWSGLIMVVSDLLISASYFSIPAVMLWVMAHRHLDLVFPWMWGMFGLFIFACGTTHFIHALGVLSQQPMTFSEVTARIITAAASVGTAAAFIWVTPDIRIMPSPAAQRAELELKVAERTKEINHRVGNQLQVIMSKVNIERRRSADPAVRDVLARIDDLLLEMGEQHKRLSAINYEPAAESYDAGLRPSLAHASSATANMLRAALERR